MADPKPVAPLRESKLALDMLSTWVAGGCPGGPWKALEPIGTLTIFLMALESRSATDPELRRALAEIGEFMRSQS